MADKRTERARKTERGWKGDWGDGKICRQTPEFVVSIVSITMATKLRQDSKEKLNIPGIASREKEGVGENASALARGNAQG